MKQEIFLMPHGKKISMHQVKNKRITRDQIRSRSQHTLAQLKKFQMVDPNS
jgi:hypothetical protein